MQTKTGETREYGVPTYGTRGEGGIDKDGTGLFRWNLVRRYDTMNNANEIVYVAESRRYRDRHQPYRLAH